MTDRARNYNDPREMHKQRAYLCNDAPAVVVDHSEEGHVQSKYVGVQHHVQGSKLVRCNFHRVLRGKTQKVIVQDRDTRSRATYRVALGEQAVLRRLCGFVTELVNDVVVQVLVPTSDAPRAAQAVPARIINNRDHIRYRSLLEGLHNLRRVTYSIRRETGV